jgi:cell filamentation protein
VRLQSSAGKRHFTPAAQRHTQHQDVVRAGVRRVLAQQKQCSGENFRARDLGILHDPPAAIPGELDRVFTDINSGVYVNRHSHEAFVHDLAGHWGDLTSVHPFVDGNSRTQRVFFDQLARDVGWAIEWRELSVDAVQAARNFAYIDGGTSSPTSYGPRSNPSLKYPRTPSPPRPARTS